MGSWTRSNLPDLCREDLLASLLPAPLIFLAVYVTLERRNGELRLVLYPFPPVIHVGQGSFHLERIDWLKLLAKRFGPQLFCDRPILADQLPHPDDR